MQHAATETMQAVVIDRFGGLDTLDVRDVPIPEVGPDDVLIRVQSAGVGVWDPVEREGVIAEAYGEQPEFPYVLGSDGAGTVAAVGEHVTAFEKGDAVYSAAFPQGGFYAEYARVPAEAVSPVPRGLTTEQAGVLLTDGVTALRGLEDVLRLQRGESVMIFGAAGGIGHLAVQLAKRLGARVFAVASGQDGVELARRLGADDVVEGHSDDVLDAARRFAPEGIDAGLVTAGGEAADEALAAVRDGGRVAYPNGVRPEPHGRAGLNVQSYDGNPDREAIDRLNRLIDAGPFDVHVARTFPLSQAAEAQRALESHYLGKLALRPA
jgi:NADPH:quinone reductase-like Zn-dependent oxidoreductase